MALWALVLLLLGLLVYVALGIRRIQTPTRGPMIDPAAQGEALLIIDMQSDFTGMAGEGDWDEARLEKALERIRERAAEFRARGAPVIVIRQVFSNPLARVLNGLFNKGRGNAGSKGVALDPRLDVTPDLDVTKTRGDGFSNARLQEFLDQYGIGRVELVGLDGAHCVQSTANGALNRGYKVGLDDDGILAADLFRWAKFRAHLLARGAEPHGSQMDLPLRPV